MLRNFYVCWYTAIKQNKAHCHKNIIIKNGKYDIRYYIAKPIKS